MDESNLGSFIDNISILLLSIKIVKSAMWANKLFIFRQAIARPLLNNLVYGASVLEIWDADKELTDALTAIS
jgi:hypothetical protein